MVALAVPAPRVLVVQAVRAVRRQRRVPVVRVRWVALVLAAPVVQVVQAPRRWPFKTQISP